MQYEEVKNLIATTFILSVCYLIVLYGPLYIFTFLCPKIAQYLYYGDDMDNPFDGFGGGGWNL